MKFIQELPGLAACENDRKPARPPRPDDVLHPADVQFENLTVQEQKCAQRLILRRCADAACDGEAREEVGDLLFSHFTGVTQVVVSDELLDPADIGLLRAWAVMPGADGAADLVEQLRALR